MNCVFELKQMACLLMFVMVSPASTMSQESDSKATALSTIKRHLSNAWNDDREVSEAQKRLVDATKAYWSYNANAPLLPQVFAGFNPNPKRRIAGAESRNTGSGIHDSIKRMTQDYARILRTEGSLKWSRIYLRDGQKVHDAMCAAAWRTMNSNERQQALTYCPDFVRDAGKSLELEGKTAQGRPANWIRFRPQNALSFVYLPHKPTVKSEGKVCRYECLLESEGIAIDILSTPASNSMLESVKRDLPPSEIFKAAFKQEVMQLEANERSGLQFKARDESYHFDGVSVQTNDGMRKHRVTRICIFNGSLLRISVARKLNADEQLPSIKELDIENWVVESISDFHGFGTQAFSMVGAK